MANRVQVVFDCAGPAKLAEFWQAVLDYRAETPPDGFATWEDWARQAGIPEERWDDFGSAVDPDGTGPRLFFQRVPEPKTVKNRVHLDVDVTGGRRTPREERGVRLAAAVERTVLLGATRLREVDDETGWFVVMADPEGNEFCLH